MQEKEKETNEEAMNSADRKLSDLTIITPDIIRRIFSQSEIECLFNKFKPESLTVEGLSNEIRRSKQISAISDVFHIQNSLNKNKNAPIVPQQQSTAQNPAFSLQQQMNPVKPQNQTFNQPPKITQKNEFQPPNALLLAQKASHSKMAPVSASQEQKQKQASTFQESPLLCIDPAFLPPPQKSVSNEQSYVQSHINNLIQQIQAISPKQAEEPKIPEEKVIHVKELESEPQPAQASSQEEQGQATQSNPESSATSDDFNEQMKQAESNFQNELLQQADMITAKLQKMSTRISLLQKKVAAISDKLDIIECV